MHTRKFFGADSLFAQCLRSKTLTYEIFRRLAREFNGDLFLVDDNEIEQINEEHLDLIFRMLTGDTDVLGGKLFLWAYDFSVVPISLISSMYEHFYHATRTAGGYEDTRGTHYTPPELAEYVLSKVLTPKVLDREPRILDPACGSGTFLVEAFNTIVRHEIIKFGRVPSTKRLQEFLLTRIAGVDLNREAIRLSAFSLYLAYLNYQTPQDIRKAGRLPRLIYHREQTVYAPLAVNDFFAPTASELDETLFAKEPADPLPSLPWPSKAFDVVVGNPPWTSPPRDATDRAESWARERAYPIGDRSPSQLFLWRTLDMLKPDGTAAMLVAATVIYNSKSNNFRRAWLDEVLLDEVVNFSQARRVFFARSVAPFCLVKYRKARREAQPGHFIYLTVRPSQPLRATRAMAYGRVDRRLVRQESVQQRDYLWKVYAWGSHHDEALMTRLDGESQLRDVLPPSDFRGGYGYQFGPDKPKPILLRLPSLRTFEPWGPIDPNWLEPPPEGVKRQPDERLYLGLRLLIRRGVKVGFGPYVRLEDSPLVYRHHIYGIPLSGMPPWQAKLLFGTLLSSLARYRLFMTSGSWAVWFDSITSEDVLQVPVRLGEQNDPNVVAICNLVDEIRAWRPTDILGGDEHTVPTQLLDELDKHVTELFDLLPAEVDLIEDWKRFSLDFDSAGSVPVSSPADWIGSSQADSYNVDTARVPYPISRYVQVFVDRWNRELGGAATLRWEIIGSRTSPTIAAVFRAVETSPQLDSQAFDSGLAELEEWLATLSRLGDNMPSDVGRSIATEGIVRVVGSDYFVIVKRNENRLWSASAAREDFEATLLSAMRLEATVTSQGLFARLGLKARYEKCLTEIVAEAAELLSCQSPHEDEPSLNRKLYRSIITTYRNRQIRGEDTPDFAPAFDAPNPPLNYEFTPSENKRPDLRWDLVDPLSDPDSPDSVRSFAVECKRLRSKSKAGWKFNKSYALHGVKRFVDLGHQYGVNLETGTMVGYWQNMTQTAVLAEVNAELSTLGLPNLVFNDNTQGSIHQTDQILQRPFNMSPYQLRHVWVDLRDGKTASRGNKGQAVRRDNLKSDEAPAEEIEGANDASSGL